MEKEVYLFRKEIEQEIFPPIEKLLKKYGLDSSYDLIIKISRGKPATTFFYEIRNLKLE